MKIQNIKIGDKIVHCYYGECKVIDVYPEYITVDFGRYIKGYTWETEKGLIDTGRMLFKYAFHNSVHCSAITCARPAIDIYEALFESFQHE